MKKLLLLLCCPLVALGQTTPNIHLNIPTLNTPGWNLLLNNNFSTIDGYIGGVTTLPNGFKVQGNITAAAVAAAMFTGNVTGNVTGNLTGNVTGNVSGNAGGLTGVPAINVLSVTLSGCASGTYVNADGTGCSSVTNILPLANTWNLPQTFIQGIQVSNNAPFIALNSSGALGKLAYVDVSNNYYFGDISNLYAGSGFWMHGGSPSLTFTNTAVTFNRPPVFPSLILNGSQSVTGIQGSSAVLLLTASGAFTPGDCINIAADGSAKDAGAGCGGGGGAVSSLTTTGNSGLATLAAGVLNIPNYTVSGVADINISIGALTIAGNSSFPQFPAAALTTSMPGVTTSMVVLCGFSGDPSITNGWGQVGGFKIVSWPSASGTVSYRIINQTAQSVTSNSTSVRCMAQ